MTKTAGNNSRMPKTRARHNARVKVMQALYQWELNDTGLKALETQFLETQEMGRVDLEYFTTLLHAIPAELTDIDADIAEALERSSEQLDPIEQAICRIGIYELKTRHDIPVKVIIDESITIAKAFGSENSFRFVNGVMNQVAHKTRSLELSVLPGSNDSTKATAPDKTGAATGPSTPASVKPAVSIRHKTDTANASEKPTGEGTHRSSDSTSR